MPKYLITIPLCGSISCEVESEGELTTNEEALQALMDKWDNVGGDIRVSKKARDKGGFEIGEIEFLEAVTQGNICYAPMTEMEFEQVEDDD